MQRTIFDSTKNVFLTFYSLTGGHLTPALAGESNSPADAHTRQCIVKWFLMV